MSNIGLYVYAPTTFTTDTTDTKIEPMKGGPITATAGEVTLQPGVYRLAEGAKLVPKTDTMGPSYAASRDATAPSYSTVSLTKGGPPDPPISPIQGYTTSQIEAFFGGAGSAGTV